MATLPFDLVEEILCRLPVKSLKRFRAVAKTWGTLIDSENFIKKHLRQSLITTSHRYLFLGGVQAYIVQLEALDRAHSISPPYYERAVAGVSNSCNGIMLVQCDPPVLWNAFSREYRIFPNILLDPDEVDGKDTYGFGYVSESDDYKVVLVTESWCKETEEWVAYKANVYSLRSNSWPRIEKFPYPMPFSWESWRVHVNGALHTLLSNREEVNGVIMAFDLRSEDHFEIMLPSGIKITGFHVKLIGLDGCLCVVCNSGDTVVKWVMKEYGVRESWVKLLTVSINEQISIVEPLTYSRDGAKLLLWCGYKRFYWCDMGSKTAEDIDVQGLDDWQDGFEHIQVCVESLVKLGHAVAEVSSTKNVVLILAHLH
ncbi:F-box protein CPR1-like [Salvia divinorum]|uniref:F-box protein CPR1-like n=1 Tax=Salvia divinorum TaxID=28513 RepID=A0ABD1IKJ9_SALDI